MEFYILFATIIVFLVFIFKREEQFKEERKELLDRIMAKSFVEFKEQTSDPVSFSPVEVSEEEEYWKEIEDQKV